MAKQTLLEIVQDILNDIDGDEVNSIDDTIESLQIANIVKSTFNAMMSNREWSHTKQLVQLNASGDNSFPTHMTLPDDIKRLVFVNYDKKKFGETKLRYEPVKYKEPDDFLRVLNLRDSDSDTVDIITDPSGITLSILNNAAPSYYTSFDEVSIIFDSYDKLVENTLQSSKVQCMAYTMPSLILSDTSVPDLPIEAFSALVEESKSRASAKLRQMSDVKSEQESRRQQRWLSRNEWTVNGGVKRPNYGRKSRK
jgi:hypothetical protein